MLSVTWLRDAYKVRRQLVKAGKLYTFDEFLAMTRQTKIKWITEAKRQYLAKLTEVI